MLNMITASNCPFNSGSIGTIFDVLAAILSVLGDLSLGEGHVSAFEVAYLSMYYNPCWGFFPPIVVFFMRQVPMDVCGITRVVVVDRRLYRHISRGA
jgi:hypothetical protein